MAWRFALDGLCAMLFVVVEKPHIHGMCAVERLGGLSRTAVEPEISGATLSSSTGGLAYFCLIPVLRG